MFVEGLLPKARERLVTITDDVWLIQPAILLASGSDLVIVCDSAGILAGSSQRRTSSAICHCHEAGCIITLCSVGRWDLLHDVWARMKERNLKIFLSSTGSPAPWDFSTHEKLKFYSKIRIAKRTFPIFDRNAGSAKLPDV